MSWSLLNSVSGRHNPTQYAIQDNSRSHIVLVSSKKSPQHVELVQNLRPSHSELGRIIVEAGVAKLEAIDESLTITPIGSTDELDLKRYTYQLQPEKNGRVEVLLLRDGDVISFGRSKAALTCKWSQAEVQVNSSATDAIVAESLVLNGDDDATEEELENEGGELDQATTAVLNTQSKSQQSRATPMPRLPHQQSIIVQETPTAVRSHNLSDLSATLGNSEGSSGAINNHLSLAEAEGPHDGEDYATARTGLSQLDEPTSADVEPSSTTSKAHVEPEMAEVVMLDLVDSADEATPTPKQSRASPQVRSKASRKRPSLAVRVSERPVDSDTDRPPKRSKKDADSQQDTQDSRLSVIDVEIPPKKTSKRKNRASAILEASETAEEVPTTSQRGSQRSKAAPGLYEGPAPRLLLSNSSSIKSPSQLTAFLKKQGGAVVNSLADEYNMLCVRDGDLTKTPKLLAAIACGVSIVTDRWLIDSAKANHLLDIAPYRPSAPKQEKEWKVKLDNIFGHPQTPFTGLTVHFTKSLKNSFSPFSDIKQVCEAAGAIEVTTGRYEMGGDTIVLAKDEDDVELQRLVEGGLACYNRDLIAHSIFQGWVDSCEDFRIYPKGDVNSTAKDTKRKGRRSK